MSGQPHCKDVEFARNLIAQMKSGNGRRNSRRAEIAAVRSGRAIDEPQPPERAHRRVEAVICGYRIINKPDVCEVGDAVGPGHFSNLWDWDRGWPPEVRMLEPNPPTPVLYQTYDEYQTIKVWRFQLKRFYLNPEGAQTLYVRVE